MRKLILLFVSLTFCIELTHAAEKVSYLYPVYNEGDATKGIKEWKTGEAEAVVVESTSDIVT